MSEPTSPDGGENGSDGKVATLPLGEPSQPGYGSGLDISMYHMKHFHLTPGKGGKAGTEISGWVGGGGGGLLVNGKGPHRRSNDGEGYGGGGGGSSKEFHYAGPGAVLLEIGTAPTTTPSTTQITTKTSTCP